MTEPRADRGEDLSAGGRTELVGGLMLIGATILAMGVANSPWAPVYDRLLDLHFEVRLGDAALSKPLLLWINDGLMALFFLLAGLELKREVLDGELSSWDRRALPLAAAAGGVALPIAIYCAWNAGDALRMRGWAIPGATDIAFAMGMLALLGPRVPTALRTFLLSLAVFDDIAAIVIIAIAYTDQVAWGARGLALGIVGVLALLNRLRVTRYGVYLLVGVVLWACVLKSGIHATLTGVVLGLTIPRRPRNTLGIRPLEQLEIVLRPWVTFLILPLFAFVNAGVALRGVGLTALADTVTLGIAIGLVGGKIAGVFGGVLLMARFGADLGADTRRVHYLGAAALAGIGFTMSLFIGVLAFEDTPRSFDVPIRVGVLAGSAVAAAVGLTILHRTLPKS